MRYDEPRLVWTSLPITCERRRGRRRAAREGACIGGATTPQPSVLRLINLTLGGVKQARASLQEAAQRQRVRNVLLTRPHKYAVGEEVILSTDNCIFGIFVSNE